MNAKVELEIKVVNEVKTYVVSLIMRAYSVIIFINCVFLVLALIPEDLWPRREFFLFLLTLDLYFVPVFWIAIDDQVSHFTTKKIKDIFLSIKNMIFY